MPNLFSLTLKLFNMLFYLIFIFLSGKGWDCGGLGMWGDFYFYVEKKSPPHVPLGRIWGGFKKYVLFKDVIVIE